MCFSRTGLDIGARFFMQHLPENLDGEIVDLGRGKWGIWPEPTGEKIRRRTWYFNDESPIAR